MNPSRKRVTFLETLRSMLNWARRPEVNKLPAGFANPLTADVVGTRPSKDPLRAVRLPLSRRLTLVEHMDEWQLLHFALVLVLPLRPDEVTAILMSDIDLAARSITCATRFGGGDYNKGKQSFTVFFPDQLASLIDRCIAGRAAGPLLRNRRVWSGRRRPKMRIASAAEVEREFDRRLAAAPRGAVQAEADRKRIFRRLLLDLGGVSPDQLAKEFKTLLVLQR